MLGSSLRPLSRWLRWGLGAALTLLVAPPLAAEGDGIYGRFDTDLRLALNAGGGAALGRTTPDGVAHAAARIRFLYAVGLGLGTNLGPRGAEGFAGFELRPLFPTLFFLNAFSGTAWTDLTLQSCGLEVGLWTPADAFGTRWRPYLALSLESPLRPPDRPGPSLWVRMETRWLASQDASSQGSEWRLLLSVLLDLRLPGHPLSTWVSR